MLSGNEIDYLAKDSGAKVLITTQALAKKLHVETLSKTDLSHILLIEQHIRKVGTLNAFLIPTEVIPIGFSTCNYMKNIALF